jgi:tyrosinase
MYLKTPTALCLLAGTLSNAITARQVESTVTTTETLINGTSPYVPTAAANNLVVASDQLDRLATFAHNQTTTNMRTNGNEKRGGCTLRNLAIRREWYVKCPVVLIQPLSVYDLDFNIKTDRKYG